MKQRTRQALLGSNQRHVASKAIALPTELNAIMTAGEDCRHVEHNRRRV